MFLCHLRPELDMYSLACLNLIIGFHIYSCNVLAQILTRNLKHHDMLLLLIDLPCGVSSYLP